MLANRDAQGSPRDARWRFRYCLRVAIWRGESAAGQKKRKEKKAVDNSTVQWALCILQSILMSSRLDHLNNRYILLLMIPYALRLVILNQSWSTATRCCYGGIYRWAAITGEQRDFWGEYQQCMRCDPWKVSRPDYGSTRIKIQVLSQVQRESRCSSEEVRSRNRPLGETTQRSGL